MKSRAAGDGRFLGHHFWDIIFLGHHFWDIMMTEDFYHMTEDFYHQLTRDEVLERLRALGDYWSAHYNVQTRWEGFICHIRGRVLGIRFRGQVSIEQDRVRG